MNARLRIALGAITVALALPPFAACSTSDATKGSDAANDGSAGGGGDAGGDAAIADANGSDSGASDAGVDAGDPCANSIFCDDFEEYEAGALPSPTWGVSQNGGTITIDGLHAHGHNAVKASAAAASGYRSVLISLTNASILPVAGNHIFGRMTFYLDSAPTASVHWTFIDGFGATSGGYHALYRYGGQLPTATGNTLMANYDTPDSYDTPPVGPGSDCYLHSATTVPTGGMSCAEWEFDGPNNTMRFWLDGAPVSDLTMNGTGQGCVNQPATFTWTAPTFDRIDLGWESYQADGARTIWIDDVAIGTKGRLACPTP